MFPDLCSKHDRRLRITGIDWEGIDTELHRWYRGEQDDPGVEEEGVHQSVADLHRVELEHQESHTQSKVALHYAEQ